MGLSDEVGTGGRSYLECPYPGALLSQGHSCPSPGRRAPQLPHDLAALLFLTCPQVWDDLCGVEPSEKADVRGVRQLQLDEEDISHVPVQRTETGTHWLKLDGIFGDGEHAAAAAIGDEVKADSESMLVSADDDMPIMKFLDNIGEAMQYEKAKQRLSDTCRQVDTTCKRAMSLFLDPKKSPLQVLHSLHRAGPRKNGEKVRHRHRVYTRGILFDRGVSHGGFSPRRFPPPFSSTGISTDSALCAFPFLQKHHLKTTRSRQPSTRCPATGCPAQ